MKGKPCLPLCLVLETRGPSALLLPTQDPFNHGPRGTIVPQSLREKRWSDSLKTVLCLGVRSHECVVPEQHL